MALYLKNKKKIETIFEKGFTKKADGLLFKGYDFKDDERSKQTCSCRFVA